jgi:hypothetical protein
MFKLSRTRIVLLGIASLVILVLLIHILRQPSNDRDWRPELRTLPSIVHDGDLLRVSNLRNSTYRNETDFDVHLYNATYNLSELESVDFFMEPFSEWKGLAHTMLSFGFADGQHLVVSIEARKEVGEEYSLRGGLTRKFELMYLLGDERDLVYVRTNHRKHHVYMYPINTTSERMRLLLLQMTEQANKLHDEPAFYNTLTDTCTSRLVKDVNAITPGRVPFSYKVLLPGYSDALAYDIGLINTTLNFTDAREHFRIDELARQGDTENFSQRIRTGR